MREYSRDDQGSCVYSRRAERRYLTNLCLLRDGKTVRNEAIWRVCTVSCRWFQRFVSQSILVSPTLKCRPSSRDNSVGALHLEVNTQFHLARQRAERCETLNTTTTHLQPCLTQDSHGRCIWWGLGIKATRSVHGIIVCTHRASRRSYRISGRGCKGEVVFFSHGQAGLATST